MSDYDVASALMDLPAHLQAYALLIIESAKMVGARTAVREFLADMARPDGPTQQVQVTLGPTEMAFFRDIAGGFDAIEREAPPSTPVPPSSEATAAPVTDSTDVVSSFMGLPAIVRQGTIMVTLAARDVPAEDRERVEAFLKAAAQLDDMSPQGRHYFTMCAHLMTAYYIAGPLVDRP